VTDPSTRVAIYARVSTSDQDVDAQLVRLREADRRIHATGNHFATDDADAGVSGRTDSRPAFDRLREEIRAGHLDVVIAAKLDRLGRSAKAVLEFFDLCEEHHVRVVLTDQAIDTGTPVGRLLRTVMAAVAEFEADLIRERTQQAMDALGAGTRKTRSGKPVGRPRRLTPEVVQRIREERSKGLKWTVVAQRVGIPAGTCRKVGPAPRSDNPRAGNPSPEFKAPASAS
jgi:putative DNA-invertase from lambdoid prophage Rac